MICVPMPSDGNKKQTDMYIKPVFGSNRFSETHPLYIDLTASLLHFCFKGNKSTAQGTNGNINIVLYSLRVLGQ